MTLVVRILAGGLSVALHGGLACLLGAEEAGRFFLALLVSASLILVPSRHESFGGVAAAAGAIGKPVVVATTDGLRDVVVDQETGCLVPVDDDTAMAQCISRLLHNAGLVRRLGEQGRQRVTQRFDVWNIQMLERIYCHVAGVSFL